MLKRDWLSIVSCRVSSPCSTGYMIQEDLALRRFSMESELFLEWTHSIKSEHTKSLASDLFLEWTHYMYAKFGLCQLCRVYMYAMTGVAWIYMYGAQIRISMNISEWGSGTWITLGLVVLSHCNLTASIITAIHQLQPAWFTFKNSCRATFSASNLMFTPILLCNMEVWSGKCWLLN